MSGPALSSVPEQELLLLCTRLEQGPLALERIACLLAGSLNWDWMIPACFRHGVAPLVYRTLSRFPDLNIPPAAMVALKDGVHRSRINSLALTGELLRVLDALQASQVRAVPLKGPVLAQKAYGDVGLRSFGDLDLLLNPEDLPAAATSLEQAGYRSTLAEPLLRAALRYHYHLVLVRPDNQSMVELHWRLASPVFGPAPDTRVLLQAAKPANFAGAEVLQPVPEITLLTLCYHGSKHWWNRVSYISAVAWWVSSHPALDWKRLWDDALRFRCSRILAVGLILARDLLAAPLPESTSRELERDPIAQKLAYQCCGWLFGGADVPPGPLAGPLFYIRLRESIADQARVLARLLFLPRKRDWSLVALPAHLGGLYYLIRPFRLLWDYLATAAAHRAAASDAD